MNRVSLVGSSQQMALDRVRGPQEARSPRRRASPLRGAERAPRSNRGRVGVSWRRSALTSYRQSEGMDGLVSMQVSPVLANDATGTIAEAERLWKRIARPSVMIKTPGTEAGLPAITHGLAAGINVNVTLLFSVPPYRQVVEAFFAGLERRVGAGHPVIGLASVASCFVSRVDGKVGCGSAAIANAAVAYRAVEELFERPRWESLAAKRAMVQRPIWASTSTKDPNLPDTYYVEALIAPLTVNPLPPANFAADRDHGKPEIRSRASISGMSPMPSRSRS